MRSSSRRQAREAALQALYTLEVGKGRLGETIKATIEHACLTGELADFAAALITGVFERQTELDERLAPLVVEWDWERIAAVDRNILRLAAYELLFRTDIPVLTAVDEAIELAKKFSTAESGKFVNGVLGSLLPDSPPRDVPTKDAAPEPPDEPVPTASPSDDQTTGDASQRAGLWKERAASDEGDPETA